MNVDSDCYSIGSFHIDIDEILRALGSFTPPFHAVSKWHQDIAAGNPDCVRLVEFEGNDIESPVQAIRIGEPEINVDQTVVTITAANHGDEVETVDSARAIVACCIQNVDVLREHNGVVVVVPLAGGTDYRLNEERLNATCFADYLAGFARWVDPNLEYAFGDNAPRHLAVEVQKQLMQQHAPVAHISLHSFLFVPHFAKIARSHHRLSAIQMQLADRYGFELLDELVEGPFTTRRARGVFDYPDIDETVRAFAGGLTSGGYLKAKVPGRASAQAVLLDSTTVDLDRSWIDSSQARLLLERLATHVEPTIRRLQEADRRRLSRDEQLIVNAARDRVAILAKDRDWAMHAHDAGDKTKLGRHTIFVLRDLALAGRALRSLGEDDLFEITQQEARVLDQGQVVRWRDKRRLIGLQLGMTMAVINNEIGTELHDRERADLEPVATLE